MSGMSDGATAGATAGAAMGARPAGGVALNEQQTDGSVEVEMEMRPAVSQPPGAFAQDCGGCGAACPHEPPHAAGAAAGAEPGAAPAAGDGQAESIYRALRSTLAGEDPTGRLSALYQEALDEEQEMLAGAIKLSQQDADDLDVEATLAELRGGTAITEMLAARFVAEQPAAGMPAFSSVPVCCDRDCLRTLWLGSAHDKCTTEQVAKVWAIYAESRAPEPASGGAACPREQPPAKRNRVQVGQKLVGGYTKSTDTKPMEGGGAPPPAAPAPPPRRRKTRRFAQSRAKKKAAARDLQKEQALLFLAKLPVHINAEARKKDGEMKVTFGSMCRTQSRAVGSPSGGALGWLLDVNKNWLYGATRVVAEPGDDAEPGAKRRREPAEEGPAQSRIERLNLRTLCQPGAREGLPRDGAALRVAGCCLGNCLRTTEAAELDSVLADIARATTRREYWEATKRALLLRPYFCDTALGKWLGCSAKYIRRVSMQDRWEMQAPEHGNTGSIPWNRLDSLRITAIHQIMDIYTYTNPEDESGSGRAPQRIFLSTQVNTRWKLYCKFEELWAPLLQKAARRTQAAHEQSRRDEGAEPMDVEEDELVQHDANAPEPQEGTPDRGNVCSYSAFKSHFDRINREDGVQMVSSKKDHNCCRTCKRLEFTIKGEWEGHQMAITKGGVDDLLLAERRREAHDRALWEYRFHNGRDHCNRQSFNHWTRIADECNAVSGQLDNVMGCPVVRRDPGRPSEAAQAVNVSERTDVSMASFYEHANRLERREPKLDANYIKFPKFIDKMMHRTDPEWKPLTLRRRRKAEAAENGTTHGLMTVAASKAKALGWWCSTKQARKHYGADLDARGDWGVIWPKDWDPDHWHERPKLQAKRLNYVIRRRAGPEGQYPTLPVLTAMWKAEHPDREMPEVEYMPDCDGNTEVFHVSDHDKPCFYQPAFDELQRRFKDDPSKEAFVRDGIVLGCEMNGVPLGPDSLIAADPGILAELEKNQSTPAASASSAASAAAAPPPVSAPDPAGLAPTAKDCPQIVSEADHTNLKTLVRNLVAQHGEQEEDGGYCIRYETIASQLEAEQWSDLRQLLVRMCVTEDSYTDWASDFQDGDGEDWIDEAEIISTLGKPPSACSECKQKVPCTRKPLGDEWLSGWQLEMMNMSATRNGWSADARSAELRKRDDTRTRRTDALAKAYAEKEVLRDNADARSSLRVAKSSKDKLELLEACTAAEEAARAAAGGGVEGAATTDGILLHAVALAALAVSVGGEAGTTEYVRPGWAGETPVWMVNPSLKPGTVRIASIDDRSDYKPPCDPNEVPGMLPRYPVHVNGFYDLSSQLMYTLLMEAGSGSKDADCVIDETFINLMTCMGKDRPQVIYLIHDCGSMELNQFQMHLAQFLVDHGFCLFVVQAYHEQLRA